MNLTEEQQNVVNYIENITEPELVLIDSVAGSGKTTLLTAIAKEAPLPNSLYLAYNKAIATSSKKKFPSYVDCRTTHSLAYGKVVHPKDLNVGFFGPKMIKEKMPFSNKVMLAEDIREFCLSSYLTYEEYAEANNRVNTAMAKRYLGLMGSGAIECTHDFYLKEFHKDLASGSIKLKPYGVVMLDEAGDLNEVTLEIFKLLPASIKIAVGDPYQNIYSFNYTINCFDRLKDQGTTFKLSKSFRVPTHIASAVQNFCQSYLNPDMEFEGIESDKTDIKTRGYISRTNAGLINKIIELNDDNTPYGLVRKANIIFNTPLMVSSLKYQGKVTDTAYLHLQEDVNDWFENKDGIKTINPNMLSYLRKKYDEDIQLVQAINLVIKHGKNGIFNAYYKAKNHENKKHAFTLLTAHSSKGLEFDEVTFAPDMNTSVEKIIEDITRGQITGDSDISDLTVQERESLNLYYVAATRALVRLNNAAYL
jgi:F-box protein 18 (helicase)